MGVLPAQLRMKESKTFSLSIQPLTALAQRSYGERDFAKAEVRKTEKRKGGERRRREGGRVKKSVAAQDHLTLSRVTENLRPVVKEDNEFPRHSFDLYPRCMRCCDIPALRAG